MNESVIKEAAYRYKELLMPPYSTMLDLDGFDAICEFTAYYGGSTLYVPSMRTIFAPCIDREIARTYNGQNTRTLAKDFGYSERRIRYLLQHER